MTPEQVPTPDPRTLKASSKWLIGALLITAISLGLLFGAFMSMYRTPPVTESTLGVSEFDVAQPLVVAVAQTPGGPAEWANWARVIKYLSEEISRPVTVRYLTKEEAAAQTIVVEDVDIAFVCAHQYLDLRDMDAVEGIVTPIVNGESTNRMMIVVESSDSAESLEDLEGDKIAASDKSSLGGYAYLQHACAEKGFTPSDFFSEVRLGETQESNMRDLLDGHVRATIVNTAQIADWDMSQFKVIEQSPPIGCPPVVVSEDMDTELREQITELLVGFDRDLLPSSSHVGGFVALDEADYAFAEILRDACGHHTHD